MVKMINWAIVFALFVALIIWLVEGFLMAWPNICYAAGLATARLLVYLDQHGNR